MRIRRLGWAGLEVEVAGGVTVVDLFEDVGWMAEYIGESREPLPPPEHAGAVDVALVTHLHADHTDPDALARALGPDGVLLRPERARGLGLETISLEPAERGLAKHGIAQRVVAPWESVEVGPFALTAVPAVDGLGNPQVSWIVAAEGRRILHAGDTLYHGAWWLIAGRHGPFDAVFLPINGAFVDFPDRQPPSPIPADMDPAQAAAAAHVLGAELAVPIHYGAIHHPPKYVQVDDPAGAFAAAADELGVATRELVVGEVLELAPREVAVAG
jgi:L-ascorbate metabolism protein UlaG (beta-lactamase superfamily)